MRERYLFLLILLPVILCCRRREAPEPGPGPSLAEAARIDARAEAREAGDRARALQEAKTIMRAARHTTTYRVVSQFSPEYQKAKGRPEINGYPITGQAMADSQITAKLIEILTNPQSYPPNHESSCLPDPGYIVRFDGTRPIDAVVCLKCGDVWFIGTDALARKTFGLSPEAHHTLRLALEEPFQPSTGT